MFVRMKKNAHVAFLHQSAFELKYVPGEMAMKCQIITSICYVL